MQDPQHLYVIVHFVDGNERQGNKDELAGAFDAAWTSPVRKGIKCRDTLDDGLRNPSRGIRTTFGDVVTDPLETGGTCKSMKSA